MNDLPTAFRLFLALIGRVLAATIRLLVPAIVVVASGPRAPAAEVPPAAPSAGATSPPPAASAMRSLCADDLLFHLSFEDEVRPELARGASTPVSLPTELQQRLVPGLTGKGCQFAGKGSTLTFSSGAGEPRACQEMYGPRANLFGAAGTVAFWIKPLPNSHNQGHAFFRAWPIQISRNQYTHHQYWYGSKGGYIYDCLFQHNPWLHFALAWRKDEARAYFNGHRMSTLLDCGVAATPERFEVAVEAQRWLEFQTDQWSDDAVLDDFQIFRRPLTDEEIRALFERGHVTTRQQVGNIPDGLVTRPERGYLAPQFTAVQITPPITVDGDLAEWTVAPHGGLVERRVGVLDSDPAQIYLACDQQSLYFGFACPVDDSIRNDHTHIWYPTGEFLSGARERDGDVRADDWVELAIRGKNGHEYRYIVNAQNTLRDERDGDRGWNTQGCWISRSDLNRWTVEAAIPLAELGAAPGDVFEFNVQRSWKLFKSSQNALCIDEHSQPAWGKLTLGSAATASVATLGKPWEGTLALAGSVQGPPGQYTVKCRTRGFGRPEVVLDESVTVTAGPAEFHVDRPLDKPGDMAVAIEVFDPQGRVLLARSIPFVYVAASTVELANYPGWGRLEVKVTPTELDLAGLRATVSVVADQSRTGTPARREPPDGQECPSYDTRAGGIDEDSKSLLTAEIAKFANPAETVAFDTRSLAPGPYLVLTRLHRGDRLLGEDIQPYQKKPLPEWYSNQAGVIDRPPVPWTDVQVDGSTVRCLLKETQFADTLFPAQILSNGQSLLAGPPRLRVVRDSVEKVLTAGEFRITQLTPRRADWQARATDEDLSIQVAGWIEFDGFTWANLTLSGGKVNRLTLEIPLDRQAIRFKNLDGIGPPGDKPLKSMYPGYWFGNEKAGFQYWWEDQRGWVTGGELTTVTPGDREVVIAVPLVQKEWEFREPRTIAIGWSTTPTKPVRKDWRTIGLYRGVGYNAGDYTFATPNYAQPRGTEQDYQRMAEELQRPWRGISCWYAFGPFMWVGAPEYAEWWREWRYTPSELARPDPNSTAWGPACYRSSSSELQIWLLDRFLRQYPQRGVYFDCMGWSTCHNPAHGCGFVDDAGVRQTTNNLLATRRHYERIYNLVKAADLQLGWVRHHDWGPNSAVAAFCDDNWVGEGYIGPLGATPEKNYYRVVDLPTARYFFLSEPWGHLTSFLTEMATTAGNDPERRAEMYGKMLRPPADGKPGEWTLPRWPDYEHVAGLGAVHDMWQIGGNDLQLPWMWWGELRRQMRWDDQVQFAGYWERSHHVGRSLRDRQRVSERLDHVVQADGGVPDQIVCSVYWRPAGLSPPDVPAAEEAPAAWGKFFVPDDAKAILRRCGTRPEGWLILVPMNNTDAEVTITLRPNLTRLGFEHCAQGKLLDIFRAYDFAWQGPSGWYANAGDPEPPYICRTGKVESFAFHDGAAQVTLPKRTFRALLLEPH